MKYLSIDVETTGLNPNRCQILEFGAIYDDLSKPFSERKTFQYYFYHEQLRGDIIAFDMNKEIISIITNKIKEIKKGIQHTDLARPEEFSQVLSEWLYDVIDPKEPDDFKLNIAGKNVAGCDLNFLEMLPGFSREGSSLSFDKWKTRARCIDPAILYYKKEDICLPDLQTCIKRATSNELGVSHRAIEDAEKVCCLIRYKLVGYVE